MDCTGAHFPFSSLLAVGTPNDIISVQMHNVYIQLASSSQRSSKYAVPIAVGQTACSPWNLLVWKSPMYLQWDTVFLFAVRQCSWISQLQDTSSLDPHFGHKRMMESCNADKGQPTESELHLHTVDYAHLRNSHGTIAVKIKYAKEFPNNNNSHHHHPFP